MAMSGREWAHIVAQHNSGTYNNQYMVIDLKLFQPRQELQPDTLWVVEQLPGMSIAADQTQVRALLDANCAGRHISIQHHHVECCSRQDVSLSGVGVTTAATR